MTSNPDQSESSSDQPGDAPEQPGNAPGQSVSTPGQPTSPAGNFVAESSSPVDVSSPAKVMRIGTMVKQLLEEVRRTDLDEKGRERLAKIHRRSIDELEDGLSKDLIDELERLDLPFDTSDGPPTNSELRIAQAQLVGWLEGLFHGIQTAIMAQQAMAQQERSERGELPPGMVAPGTPPTAATNGQDQDDTEGRRTGNYL
ncbi:proteasome activator [Brevibacterium sp. CBA3109]|uniref:Bacterial proteasome activator n=1 Tax=Brevibacterium koreense TaxID=3140787 RepID=A0AAU7UIY4_9MICO